eukprot:764888-Hanusia_phi.AAC.3
MSHGMRLMAALACLAAMNAGRGEQSCAHAREGGGGTIRRERGGWGEEAHCVAPCTHLSSPCNLLGLSNQLRVLRGGEGSEDLGDGWVRMDQHVSEREDSMSSRSSQEPRNSDETVDVSEELEFDGEDQGESQLQDNPSKHDSTRLGRNEIDKEVDDEVMHKNAREDMRSSPSPSGNDP